MSLTCSLTGKVPTDPVVSSTGYLFEREAILKSIDELEGKCPVSGEPLGVNDLQDVKVPAQPLYMRTIPAANIPGVLNSLHREFENLLQLAYLQKVDIDESQKQLRQALHQNDGATRCIKRLLNERDDRDAEIRNLEGQLFSQRKKLVTLVSEGESIAAKADKAVEEVGYAATWASRIAKFEVDWTKAKKEGAYKLLLQHVIPFATNKEMKLVKSFEKHQSTAPGINCVAVNPMVEDNILTGGVDGNIESWNRVNGALISNKLTGHEHQITALCFHPVKGSVLASGSKDGVSKIWNTNSQGAWEPKHTLRGIHDGAINDMVIHGIGDLLVQVSQDASISFVDMNSGSLLKRIKGMDAPLSKIRLHPNGKAAFVGVGCSVQLWDLQKLEAVGNLQNEGKPAHDDLVTSVGVSGNATIAASGSQDGIVHLWDLRKQQAPLQTLKFSESAVNCLRFDASGQYLGIGLNETVRIYHFETKNTITELCSFPNAHGIKVSDIIFGACAKYCVSVGLDRKCNVYQSPKMAEEEENPSKKRKME